MLSLEANFHREDHSHIEIAMALDTQVKGGTKPLELAERLSKSSAWVYNYLRLMDLLPELQEKMHPSTPPRELLRFVIALKIAQLPKEKQMAAYRFVTEGDHSLPERAHEVTKYVESNTTTRQKGRPHDAKKRLERFVSRARGEMLLFGDMSTEKFNRAMQSLSEKDRTAMQAGLADLQDKLSKLIVRFGEFMQVE